MKQLEAIQCTKEDLPRLIEIIQGCNTLYGINIVENGIRDSHIRTITEVLELGSKNTVIVGVKKEGILISFCSMIFWDTLPCWSAHLLYDSSNHFDKLGIEGNVIAVLGKFLEIAEARNVYNFYFVTRYSRLWKRVNILFLENSPGYHIGEIEVLEPYEESKYGGIRKLMGPISGNNSKSVVVLQGFKPVTFEPIRLMHNQPLPV